MQFLTLILISSYLFINNNAHYAALNFTYHNYDNLTNLLHSYSHQYPNKTYLYSIGRTIESIYIYI